MYSINYRLDNKYIMLRINLERISTISIILITLVLFAAAVFTKGLTHDIFLETAVFLVSVKVIFLTFRTNTMTKNIIKKLEDLNSLLLSKEK